MWWQMVSGGSAHCRAPFQMELRHRQRDPGEARKEQKARAVQESRNTFEAIALDWLMH